MAKGDDGRVSGELQPMAEVTQEARKREPFVGRPMERVEDETLLRGLARYADDFPVRHDTLQAAMLRSPHAHAEIVSIDATRALARPGVVAVITGKDVQDYTDPFLNAVKQPMKLWSLAVDRVRYVGEALALVIAQDRYKAEDAVEHIDVVYPAARSSGRSGGGSQGRRRPHPYRGRIQRHVEPRFSATAIRKPRSLRPTMSSI